MGPYQALVLVQEYLLTNIMKLPRRTCDRNALVKLAVVGVHLFMVKHIRTHEQSPQLLDPARHQHSLSPVCWSPRISVPR